MSKKVHFIVINVIYLFLIAFVVALPLFKFANVDTIFDNNLNSKTIFGYHLLSGFSCNGLANEDIGQGIQQVMKSKLLGFIPLAMLISMIIVDKVTKNNLGKDAINFLGSLLIFVFYLLLPAIIQTFLVDKFVDSSVFTTIWGYWILLVLFALLFIYCTVTFIKNIIKTYKENDIKERNA